MGWTSKLEDETERREGHEPRLPTPRFVGSLADLGLVGDATTTLRPRIVADGSSQERFDELLRELEESAARISQCAHDRRLLTGKEIRKRLGILKKHSDAIRRMIAFLSPIVQRLPFGPEKRDWQIKIKHLEAMAKFR